MPYRIEGRPQAHLAGFVTISRHFAIPDTTERLKGPLIDLMTHYRARIEFLRAGSVLTLPACPLFLGGGLNLDNLPEEVVVDVEDDY